MLVYPTFPPLYHGNEWKYSYLCYWYKQANCGLIWVLCQYRTINKAKILFCDHVVASLSNESLPKGSTLKGKNLLLKEQILFFKSRSSLRREAKNGRVASHESACINKAPFPSRPRLDQRNFLKLINTLHG